MPSGTEALTAAAARVEDQDVIVWRGDPELPEVEQGIRLLGTPLGHPVFVEDQLAWLTMSHRVWFDFANAVRTSPTAHWASWAESLPMIQKWHPAVARLIVAQLSGSAEGPEQGALAGCQLRCPHVDSDCRWSAPQPPRR